MVPGTVYPGTADRAPTAEPFDPHCRRCPRLVRFREASRHAHPGHHGAPVRAVGRPGRPVMIVGLAPGLHGGNATGWAFIGDAAGKQLFAAMERVGLDAGDGGNTYITNAVRCVPPGNRPTATEQAACRGYLTHELAALPAGGVVVALGRLAHAAVRRAMGLTAAVQTFRHGGGCGLPGERMLLDSYHCSRYNMNTGRLTPTMLSDVLGRARQQASGVDHD